MARVYRNERVLLTAMVGPVERASYRLMRVDPEVQQDWRGLRAHHARVQRRLASLALYLILRTQGSTRSTREGFGSGPWDLTFNTTSSFVTQYELAVLRRRDDAVVLLADGRPGRAELRLGRRRHGGAGGGHPRVREPRGRRARQLLAGPGPDAALHPAAVRVHRRAGAGLAGRRADARGLRDLRDRAGRRADARARARRRRRSRSSSSARTAAASSTSTARCRSRTRRGCRTSSRSCSSC